MSRPPVAAVLVLALAAALATGAHAQSAADPPAWAYPVNPPDLKPPAQALDLFTAPDWHPADHPPMPEVVARGRKPDVFACGLCHRADGPGGPENASLAGLPAEYIVRQMADFKSGARTTSVPERLPTRLMASLSRAVTDAEVAAAAAYFSALKPRPIIRVVETNTVPKSFVARWFLAASATGVKESIGQRIIEVPEDLEQFERRDARSRFIAYVPVGSIRKGRALATTGGGGRTVACGDCHGRDLKGIAPVPGIAGRSPSYLVRQLYDFKHGARAGDGVEFMKPTVAKLTIEDMVSLAAYAASLKP